MRTAWAIVYAYWCLAVRAREIRHAHDWLRYAPSNLIRRVEETGACIQYFVRNEIN